MHRGDRHTYTHRKTHRQGPSEKRHIIVQSTKPKYAFFCQLNSMNGPARVYARQL